MLRPAFKPDSSFFRKIAIGAVGARAVCSDLGGLGHEMIELERGSTDTKLWKDVKRKRVRIPDLVCKHCGIRVESRAKTKTELSMSHSPNAAERAWDFGMVDYDIIAFPVCTIENEVYWSTGKLVDQVSYWHERNWVDWKVDGYINYFTVRAFRSVEHNASRTKGVTEGSETSIVWQASFAKRSGTVVVSDGEKITIERSLDGRKQTLPIRFGLQPQVEVGDRVRENQVLSSAVQTLQPIQLSCPHIMGDGHITSLLISRERTQRFTGVKLARVRGESQYRDVIEEIVGDAEEDVYIRLEGAAYLASVCKISARALFRPYLESNDNQTRLEAVIALGETVTPEAVSILSELLNDVGNSYFIRSAAAWALSRAGGDEAIVRLVAAFEDIDQSLRSEALDGIVAMGGATLPILLAGLNNGDDIAAGCAEALRQQTIPETVLQTLISELRTGMPSTWTVWLLGQLPKIRISTAIAELQNSAPELYYALSVLWSFVESWIAHRWEVYPQPKMLPVR